jgi:hypothetical protein
MEGQATYNAMKAAEKAAKDDAHNGEDTGLFQPKPLREIIAGLSKPVPPRLLKHKQKGGAKLTFVPWYKVVQLLDHYAPGWEGEVTKIHTDSKRIYLTYKLTIVAQEGRFSREATGTEVLDTSSYGDPSSNAESMAFRRAAA